MKIAVIGAKGLPAKQGGIEHYCEAIYPKMIEQGHSVDLFARSSYIKKPWFSVSRHQGVQIICLPSLHLKGLDAFTNSCLAALVASGKDYDVIHFHALGPSLFSFIPRLLSPAKIVVTCHGLDWQRKKWGKFASSIIRLGEKTASIYAHEIVVVSKTLETYFKKTYYIRPIYIPTAPSKYAESDPNFRSVKSWGLEPRKYLLYLGRLVPEKRADLLIQAFLRLKKSGWKLVLTGGGSDTTKFDAELHELAQGNADLVFTGELTGSPLAEMVRGAGIFVSASDLEGLPLSMLEAMREGVPVVASDIPPHQQLLGSDRGLLFNSNSITSCAMALEEGMLNPEKLAVMAEKAQAHVKANYDWSKITADNLAIFAKNLWLGDQSSAKFVRKSLKNSLE